MEAEAGDGSGGAGTPHDVSSGAALASTSARDADDTIIEFRGVSKSFGSKQVLRDVSFTIRRGEAVGIIGPSGTGKSTVLRLICGLIAPDSGEILLNGVPSDRVDDTQGSESALSMRLQLGLVFQNGALFDSLTVAENVGFRLYEHSRLPESTIKAMVSENLAKVGLNGIEERYPSELSGGMKKRVALARAITTEPHTRGDGVEEVVLYDEPTAGLDPVASTVVEDLMRSMHERHGQAGGGGGACGGVVTYVVVTHQESTIKRAVDRIVFLHKGRVVWEGTQAEFDQTDEEIVVQWKQGGLIGPISYI